MARIELTAALASGLLCLSTPCAAQGAPPIAPTIVPPLALEQLPIAADWGPLRLLAGRDLQWCTMVNCDEVIVGRWEKVDQVLLFASRAAVVRYIKTDRGIFVQYDGKQPLPIYQLSDGVLVSKPSAYTVTMAQDGDKFVWNYYYKSGERLKYFPSPVWMRMPIAASPKFAKRLVELTAKYSPSSETGPFPSIGGGSFEVAATKGATEAVQFFRSEPPSKPTLTSSALPQKAGPRIALVIGNSVYGANLGSLANPANDARLIADGLRASGFQVELVLNADQKGMKRAISNLGQRMAAAGQGATGLFYFAGHGMQSRGINYLIPTGATILREADVDLEAVAADTVLAQMEEAAVSTNIVILDACRNTPVLRSFRSGARGLARMDAPNGSFISYSTAPGSVAYDGDGSNSPFAVALAREVRSSKQPIEIMFRNVRRSVLDQTGGAQTPWDSSSLIDSFTFNPG